MKHNFRLANLAGICIIFLLILFSCSVTTKKENNLFVYHDTINKELAFTYGNELLSIFRYDSSLYKPFFHPVNDVNGSTLTRGYPLDPLPGEKVDHPHQTGMWFNFGDVNGFDFWNNSDAIPVEKKSHFGKIVCHDIDLDSTRLSEGLFHFTISADWLDYQNNELLLEKTDFYVSVSDSMWSLDRKTQFTAATEIHIKDNKEGLFAIRLAREFQSDFEKPSFILDSTLNITSQKIVFDEGKQGHYFNAQGKTGNEVFGTQSKWAAINTVIKNDSITLVFFDHPENYGFPGSAFARDYGLFALNNFGKKSYDDNLDPFELSLHAGDSIYLQHRILFYSKGFMDSSEINLEFDRFVGENKLPND